MTFPYLARDHVKLTLDAVASPAFTWLTDSMIQLATAPGPDVLVDIRRQTPQGTPVDFEDGSVLAETDLDLLATYTAYLSEEARDGSEDSLKKNLVGQFDGRGIRVTNVAPGEHPTDAVNKSQLVAQQAVVEPLVEAAVQAAASANSAKNASEIIAEKFGDVDSAVELTQTSAAAAANSEAVSTSKEALATAAAAVAVNARDASLIQAGVYTTEAAGRAAVADGQAYKVQGAGDVAAYEYRRINAGASTLIATYPSASAIQEKVSTVEDASVLAAITDGDGFAALALMSDKSLRTSVINIGEKGITYDGKGIVFDYIPGVSVGYIDADGFIANAIPEGTSEPTNAYTEAEINARNLANLVSTEAVKANINTEVARPIFDYNVFILHSQSLGTGYEGWPALSKTARPGCLMYGGAVRPLGSDGSTFVPVGGAALNPMVAVVQHTSTRLPLSDSAVAALPPGSANEGESPLEGAVNLVRKMHNNLKQVPDDTARKFIAINTGVAGMPIEKLSKVNPLDGINRYSRMTDAATKLKALADSEGKTIGLVGVFYLGNEYNYATTWGGVATKAEYKALLQTMRDNIVADIATGIFGQSAPPAFITYQTSAQYTADTHDLAIGMAQLEIAQENRNWYVATPSYPFPDKGGHLTSNGYRWMGKQLGKVWFRVAEMGQGWRALSPIKATVRGREILVDFHVPNPPLVFDDPYIARTATAFATKGFTVLVGGVKRDITALDIVSPTQVRITLAAEAVGSVALRYADKANHNGHGSLRDSDPTVSDDTYEYSAGSGQYADENIPALVSRPYPLGNWCAAFHIPVTPN